MVATLPFNAITTTTSAGTFVTTSDGGVQGTFLDDPALRFELMGGILSGNETIPMWGGVGLYEYVPTPISGTSFASPELGPVVGRATALAPSRGSATAPGTFPLTAFSVFNQAVAMIGTPSSPVPLAASQMSVNYLRLGSGMRVWLACDPSLVSLEAGTVQPQVSWDFTLQRVIPYVASYLANVVTAATWASTGGGQITFTTTTSTGIVVGDDFTTSGFTPAGYNGTFTAITGTSGSTLIVSSPVNPGAESVLGQVNPGGGALPVLINRVMIGNCMTVNYATGTGYATWNYNGSAVLVQL